mgnify:CR=1 FL=1
MKSDSSKSKRGRIKKGEGNLIGNAGEHFVMSGLLIHGWIAALAPRNAPSFDILAVKNDKTLRIRVKTKSADFDSWVWNTKKDGTIFKDLQKNDDITAMVDLTHDVEHSQVFFVPTYILDKLLMADFDAWRKSLGKNGHIRDESSHMRRLSIAKYQNELAQYRGWIS